jgi:site-specific DNA-cytosine methylase
MPGSEVAPPAARRRKKTFYLVELFSGTGSFGRAAQAVARDAGMDFQLLSLDIHPKYHPTHCVNVLEWDYKRDVAEFLAGRRPGDVVWVHASPPCSHYSHARRGHDRDLAGADAIVRRSLKITAFARPTWWTLENPVGLLQTRPFMRPLEPYRHVTSYCLWNPQRPFRKHTSLWSPVPLQLEHCGGTVMCASKARLGRHPLRAQTRDALDAEGNVIAPGVPLDQLYEIPKRLCKHIVAAALAASDG